MKQAEYRVHTIALHITQVCSHQCPFCYAASSPKAKHHPYQKLLEVIQAIAAEGVQEVVFLGGDPCEYPRLLDLCEEAKEYGLENTVLSNTHKYPIGEIERAVNVIDVFETTFHGPNAREHDSIAMVDGAFDASIRILKVLAERGARSIGIVYNITPYNAKHLYETVKVLVNNYGLPIDHLLLQRIIPQGRGKSTAKFTVGNADILSAMADLKRISDEYRIGISFEDPVPYCTVPQEYHIFLNRCQWGFTHAALDWQGDLSRCGADPRYQLGNVLKTPLSEIWNSSPVLESFRSRDYLPEECQECELLDSCGGGCALSCELNADHGIDYLYFEKEQDNLNNISSIDFRRANVEDLSDILRIEWACFPNYEFKFSPNSLKKWYAYNSSMFHVLEASNGFIYGYACLVPLTEDGFRKMYNGKASSLTELSPNDVIGKKYPLESQWHVEVIATIKVPGSSTGKILIREVGAFLVKNAKIVLTSPITEIGVKLCHRFNFSKVASKNTNCGSYDIYMLEIEKSNLVEVVRDLR